VNLSKLSKSTEYIHILKRIQKYIPTAIVAGGVIRDLYHNKPVNDIDIFVPSDSSEYAEKVSVFMESFWKKIFDITDESVYTPDRISILGEGSEEYEQKNQVEMVWGVCKNRIDYNIIVLDMDPTEYVNRFFDVGLCKAYCDGTKIRLTSDFLYDSQHKLLTVVSESMPHPEFDYMMDNHIVKLQEKYPNHKLVILPHYHQFT